MNVVLVLMAAELLGQTASVIASVVYFLKRDCRTALYFFALGMLFSMSLRLRYIETLLK